MGLFRKRSRAISSSPDRSRRAVRGAMLSIGAVFTLMGGAFVYFILLQPLLMIQAAKDWVPTPCVIVSSEVESHRSDDGYTYSIEITYRYTVDGVEHQSDRYHFMSGSSSGRSGKQAVVDRYPPGSEAVCYVDPNDPTQAVIERGYTADLLFGLIPLVFVIVGVGLFVAGLRVGRKAGTGRGVSSAATPLSAALAGGSTNADATADGPVELRSGGSRWTKVIFLAFFAAFWNGISWTMLVLLYNDGEWFGVAFLTLFCLIGLAVIGGLAHSALALWNPTVTLTLDRAAVPLGEPLRLRWRLDGNVGRLDRFRLVLEGQEKATYRRGTNTVTDTHAFRTIELVDLTDRRDILTAAGDAEVTIPADTMHSWSAQHNEIVWSLKAMGTIRRWPDVNDEFKFTVLPMRGQALAAAASSRQAEESVS